MRWFGRTSLLLVLGLAALHASAGMAAAGIAPYPGPDDFGYRETSTMFNLRAVNLTGGTNVSLSDDVVSGFVPLGFNFSFYGNTYSQARIGSNGFITFNNDPASGCCNGTAFYGITSSPSNLVAGFWMDLYPPSNEQIYYQTRGTAGSQEFVVGYYAIPEFGTGTPQTFEIILHEGT